MYRTLGPYAKLKKSSINNFIDETWWKNKQTSNKTTTTTKFFIFFFVLKLSGRGSHYTRNHSRKEIILKNTTIQIEFTRFYVNLGTLKFLTIGLTDFVYFFGYDSAKYSCRSITLREFCCVSISTLFCCFAVLKKTRRLLGSAWVAISFHGLLVFHIPPSERRLYILLTQRISEFSFAFPECRRAIESGDNRIGHKWLRSIDPPPKSQIKRKTACHQIDKRNCIYLEFVYIIRRRTSRE